MDTRYGRAKWGPHGTRTRTADSNWRQPLRWNRQSAKSDTRARVFSASLADVFEDWPGNVLMREKDEDGTWNEIVLWHGPKNGGTTGVVRAGQMLLNPLKKLEFLPGYRYATLDDVRLELFHLIDITPSLDWLLLTKRPENVRQMWPWDDAGERPIFPGCPGELGKPLPCVEQKHRTNVWLGTSIESNDQISRWHELAKCRELAPVLWISAEPLLGPLDVAAIECDGVRPDWIVFGGESDQGQPARPCNVQWIRDGVRQCRELGIVPFVKQLGSNSQIEAEPDDWDWPATAAFVHGRALIEFRDRAGANPDEWPDDLRVRVLPEAVPC